MTSLQVQEWLREGIAAAKVGDASRAYDLLLKVVDVDEYNEQAWLWLSSVVDTDADREVCLENVLAINPDNKLAKTGLVHLHSLPAQPPPLEFEPPTGSDSPDLLGTEDLTTEQKEWWDRPQTIDAFTEFDDSWKLDLSPAAAAAMEAAGVEAVPQRPQSKRTWRPTGNLIWRLATLMLFLLGTLAAVAAVAIVLRTGLLDPAKRDYASAMRPLLDEYQAWWEGPQGKLTGELSSLCGPEADGWRNRDVLAVCSAYPTADCAALSAHCEADIEAMREYVADLSQEVQKKGGVLLAALDGIAPPDDIAPDHERFLACIRAQLTQASRVSRLARGEVLADLDLPTACQVFTSAEIKVRAYVGMP